MPACNAEKTEYQLHKLKCAACGKSTHAKLLEERASILRVALGDLVRLPARQKAGIVRGTLRSLRTQLAWREMQLEVLNALLKPLHSDLDDFRWLFKHACNPNHTRDKPTDILTKLGPDGLFPL